MARPDPGPPADATARDAHPAPAYSRGFDLVESLVAFLSAPPPLTLLLKGEYGTGKSTLLQSLLPRLKGPRVLVAYRSEGSGSALDWRSAPPDAAISLLLVDPSIAPATTAGGGTALPQYPMGFAPTADLTGEGIPRPLAAAFARLGAGGGGYVIVDSWDPASESAFRAEARGDAGVFSLQIPAHTLRTQFGRLPVRMLLAVPGESEPEMISISDGVIELGWEDVDGFRVRVASIRKLRKAAIPQPRHLYSLDGQRFYSPPQFGREFEPPIGPPDPDPHPDQPSLFPGNVRFEEAFGRLRTHGLTGLEISPKVHSGLVEVFLIPLVAHVIGSGGRVVWIPSAASGPSLICEQLTRFVAAELLPSRLRILTAGEPQSELGELADVALPVSRPSEGGKDAQAKGAAPAGALFPEAYRFLQDQSARSTALYVMALDGLGALAALSGGSLNPATLPLTIGAYARLPGFHGFGYGRTDEPITRGLIPNLTTHIRLDERYGRAVLVGSRPATTPYLLDWRDDSGRYDLVSLA